MFGATVVEDVCVLQQQRSAVENAESTAQRVKILSPASFMEQVTTR